jgi:pimeloyl-ACP methyl ester carboxylesterase
MNDPAEAQPAARKRKPRRIFGIGALLLSVPIILWIGAAFIVARSLRYPDFFRRGGEDVFGQNVPQFKRGSVTDIGDALGGIEPERLDCGVVEEDAIGHHQASVVGWYFPGKRREVVMIIPAAGAPETAMIPYVKFLLGAGYTVVATYSANDPSYGISWGMLKRKFALATARTLRDDGFTKIAALGISEGAAGAIMAQAEQPVFSAIVADSSYANLKRLFMRSPSLSRLNPAFMRTVLWEAQLWFGRPLDEISPETDAGNLGQSSLLIIQNRDDQVTPVADGKALLDAAGFNAQMWTVPSGGHGDAIFEEPKEYAARVIKFLDASFEIEQPAAKPHGY